MFYDKFKHLCQSKGVSCNKAAADIGLSNATPTMWKKRGLTPKGDTLARIAEYFGVSIEYLLAGEETLDKKAEKATVDVIDDDLREYLDELRSRPEQRLLFSVTKNASKAQIEAIVKMIKEMQGYQ
jgi:transcriptional regulator with XRE-family HTH domain